MGDKNIIIVNLMNNSISPYLQHVFIEWLLIMFCGVSFDIGSSIWIVDIQRLCKSYIGSYMVLKKSLQDGSFAPIMFEEILAVH